MRRVFFSFWYLFSKPPWDTGIPAPELVRAIAHRPPGEALDLGCGTGTNVRYLAEHGWRATGLDFAPPAIAEARRRLRGLPVDLRVADVTHLAGLDLSGPFDLALDMGCFHSLPTERQRPYVVGLKRWLKPGSVFLLYAWQTGPEGQGSGRSREAVVAAFEDGFKLDHYEQGQGRPSAWYYFSRIS